MNRIVRWAAVAALSLAGFSPTQSQARIFVGFGFGFPVYAPPLVYAPPPVYYAPPYYAPPYYAPPYYTPGYYAPNPAYAPYYGRPYGVPPANYAPAGPQLSARCNAGVNICPTDVPRPVGEACSCPANVGRVAGRVG